MIGFILDDRGYGANISGTISGNQINFTVTGGGGGSGALTISPDGNSLSGTGSGPDGRGGVCAYNINLSRTL